MIDQVIGAKYTDNDVVSIDHGQLYAQEPGKELISCFFDVKHSDKGI